MWRIYKVAQCDKCKHEVTTRNKVYKYDDDEYHDQAFRSEQSMVDDVESLRNSLCPKCGGSMSLWGWSDTRKR